LTLTRDRGLAEDAMADTFLTAWQRMSQLRDPSQVRSWLFAIAKNRVSRLGAKASRQIAVDPSGAEMRSAFDLDDSTPDSEVAESMSSEVAVALVWEAAEGLNENERAVLELSVRQGVEGEELATALGVSRHNANVIASRMRQNLERSVGALFLLRYNDDGCLESSQLVAGFSGALTPLWRKRISRHAEACEICSKKKAPKAMALFGETPVSAAPISARSALLGSLPTTPDGLPLLDTSTFRAARSGFPAGGGVVRRVLVGVSVAVVAVVFLTMATVQVTGNGVGSSNSTVAIARDAETTETETLLLEEIEINETSTTSTSPVTRPETPGSPAPVPGVDPSAGAPSSSSSTTAAPDKSAPKITSATLSTQSLVSSNIQCTALGRRSATLTVTAVDNVGVVSGSAKVEVSGMTTPLTLTGSGSTFTATVGPFTRTGSFSVVQISVVDAAGNRSAAWSSMLAGGISC